MDLITYALLKRQITECEANIEAIIPYIGENGNWYVGDTDTGKPSRGDKGPDGKSAYQYAQNGGYTGTEEEFTAKLAAENIDKALFVVNITSNGDGTYSADKTFDEIVQVYNEGKYNIVANVAAAFDFFPFPVIAHLTAISEHAIGFSNSFAETNIKTKLITIVISSNNELIVISTPLATMNSKLPNPNALTFTGAVTGSYDGSSAKTIEIPIVADGIMPTIGDNGNWYLGDTDTGKPSRGDKGPNGKSAYSYAQDGGYTDTEANFYADLAAMQGLASALAAI